MAAIDVARFRGGNTVTGPRKLEAGEALSATSVVFDERGSVRPLAGLAAAVHTMTAANSKTFFPYDVSGTRYWLEWAGDVDVTAGPIDNDTYQRLYYTGDGVPKMTFNTIFDDGAGVYPRTSRPLGILAPTAKPDVAATLPETVIAGAITALTVPSLLMIHECKSSEGRNSGNGQSLINATTTPTALTTLPVGTRLKVSGIVDANNVTVTGVSDIGYACVVEKRDYGLEWSGGDNLWRKRKKAYWNFLVPGGAELAIASHGLQTGDILQITSVSSQMAWEFNQLTSTPNTDQYARTATRVATGDIVFDGNVSFIIDRNGVTIDPLVPQQNYLIETRAYVYTYVSDLGEEGPPSPPSDIVTVVVGDPVTIDNFTAPVADGRVITHRRIYRTNTGSETTELQFVTELLLATTSYVDTLGSEELAEVLPSETWEPPPATLKGLVMLPNGSACGFYGKTLCFSEPGYPHAWPPEYQYTVDFDIVGVEVYGTSVLAATAGTPYVATGNHPRQMSARKITEQAQACISKRSVVSTTFGVVFATPDGLVRMSESGVDIITSNIFTPRQWKALVGLTSADTYEMLGAWHENTLYMFVRNEDEPGDETTLSFFFGNGGIDYCLVGSLLGGGTQRYATAVYVDPTSGVFYGTFAAGDNVAIYPGIEDPSAANAQYGYWQSGVFSFPRPVNLAYGLVTFAAPALSGTDVRGTIELSYLDSAGNVVSAAVAEVEFLDTVGGSTVRLHDVFRLPSEVSSDSVRFKLALNGPVKIERVQLAEHISELR